MMEQFRRAFGPTGDPDDAGLYSGAGTLEEAVHELYKVVPEVNIVHLALTLLSFFIVFFGLFSGLVKEKLFIGEAIIATVFGIAFSGYSAGIFAPRTWSEGHHFDEITLELTRIIIALSVFAVGVELPKAYVLRHWRSLVMLLGPIMLFGWLIAASLIYAIIPGIEFLPALVVAAGVTPTDPILASSVVGKGKFAQEHVPSHIRHMLQAESGSNDGAAFPFLYLAMFLLLRDHYSVGEAIGWWFVLVVLYQIVLGCFIGAIVGIAARKLLKYSKRRDLIDRESMVAMYVALALLVTGLTTLAGSDDLLAAFACGTAFAWDDWFSESIEESNFSSVIDLLVNCAMFIYLGATMPFSAWNNPALTLTPWRLVLLAIGILTLRRLPAMFLLSYWIPDIKTRREAVFAGHFGPIGVGAIFISTLAASKLPTPTLPPETSLDILALTVQPITYFLVLSSILIHGLTISFFSLGRRVHSRVTSISRTFTAASGNGEEPSWMSRVKRARAGEDIVINRDDDDTPVDDASRAEKGIPVGNEGGIDTGTLAMFGAPSRPPSPSSSNLSKSSVDHETEKQLESDDNPPDNILSEGPTRREIDEESHHHHSKTPVDGPSGSIRGESPSRNGVIPEEDEEEPEDDSKATPAKKADEKAYTEGRYCKTGQTQSWREGRKIIIDRNDGTDPEVIDVDPTSEQAEAAKQHPKKSLVAVPQHAIDGEKEKLKAEKFETDGHREESAVKRATMGMLRKGSLLAVTENALRPLKKPFDKHVDETLTPEQREEKQRKKMERDLACRKEKHYRDENQEWVEGDKVVTESGGEKVQVRKLTEEERHVRAAKHLAALKALGLGSLEVDLNKLIRATSRESEESGDYFSAGRGKGKSKATSPAPRRKGVSPSPARKATSTPLASPALDEDRPRSDSPEGMRSTSPEPMGLRVPSPGPSRSASRSPSPEPLPRTKRTGIALERTDRIVESDEEDEADVPVAQVPASEARRPSASPAPKRGNSLQVMRQLFKRQPSASPETGERGRPQGARSSSPERPSIRFVAPDRPARDGTTSSGGRALPIVGAGLSARKQVNPK